MRRDGGRQLVGVLCAPPLSHQTRLQGSGLAVGFRVEDLGEFASPSTLRTSSATPD